MPKQKRRNAPTSQKSLSVENVLLHQALLVQFSRQAEIVAAQERASALTMPMKRLATILLLSKLLSSALALSREQRQEWQQEHNLPSAKDASVPLPPSQVRRLPMEAVNKKKGHVKEGQPRQMKLMKHSMSKGSLMKASTSSHKHKGKSSSKGSTGSTRGKGDSTTSSMSMKNKPNTPTSAPKACFQTNEELREAVLSYADGDTTVSETYGHITNWCVGQITNFNFIFSGVANFNEPLSGWDVSRATSMDFLFNGAISFNQNLDMWDVSRVTSMRNTFNRATSFRGNVATWDVSSVTFFTQCFWSATSFNSDITKWNPAGALNMDSMFRGTNAFNQDISKWDVSSVLTMESMFWGATGFNQDIGGWDVRRVTNMAFMFSLASFFDQDLSQWVVAKITDMRSMFSGASTFSRDLCAWGRMLDPDVLADMAFQGTRCPDSSIPDLDASPPGPLCFPCN